MPDLVQLLPADVHNRALEANVHPPDGTNPTPSGRYHLVVIGAGTAGLVTAAGAAGLGARVALIERDLMGGDCLNVGCVPSKGIISAARVAATIRNARQFGIDVPDGVRIDFAAVMERMRKLRAQISPNDSAQRFRDLGIDVYLGQGRFLDSSTIEVDGAKLNIKRAVIGAGPIGCEMAQTFAQFGAKVLLIEAAHGILPREDRDAADIVQQAIQRDGVQVLCCGRNLQVTKKNGIRLRVVTDDRQYDERVDGLLVAVGRAPNVENLNLDAMGVAYGTKGVQVNDRLQTTNPQIYAAEDVCSPYQFTHAADFMARLMIQKRLGDQYNRTRLTPLVKSFFKRWLAWTG